MMERRKIQLIAGMTYSISLPKEWVLKNHLKEKDELILLEKDHKTLLITPEEIKPLIKDDIIIHIDEYKKSIDQILLSLYYQGFENIHLVSKSEMHKDIRGIIRKTLTHMSGTEIIFEDKNNIKIKVLLDKTRLDILQLFYRIVLILNSSQEALADKLNIEEIRINENEIDRLYHLSIKVITLSINEQQLLDSSKIQELSLIPSFFLISKKLENIGDSINHMSSFLLKEKISFSAYKEILESLIKEITKSINHLMRRQKRNFDDLNDIELNRIKEEILKIKNKGVQVFMFEILRFTEDVQKEVINILFFSSLKSSKDY